MKLTPALFLVHLWVSGQRSAVWQTGRVGASDGPRNRSLWGLTQRITPDHTTGCRDQGTTI